MPFLKIEVSSNPSDISIQNALEKTRNIIHEVKGDSLSMIEVAISKEVAGIFGNSNASSDVANLHLTSFSMTPEITLELTRQFSNVLWEEFRISADSAYIFFTNIEEPHLTGWNGRTFSELLSQKPGGRQDLNRRLFGRLIGSPPQGNILTPPVPLSGLLLEIWNPMAVSLSDEITVQTGELIPSYLGSGVVDSNGFFKIFFNDDGLQVDQPTTLELRVYEPEQIVLIEGEKSKRRFVALVHPVTVPPQSRSIPIGNVRISFYEYDPQWPFPYALPESIRQGFSSLQETRYLKASAKFTPILQRLILEIDSTPGGLSIDQVQTRYPKNTTINLGSVSRSDDYFCERILNALIPPVFQLEQNSLQANGSEIFVIDMNWREFKRRPELTLLSFKARFTTDGNKLLAHDILIGLNNEDDPSKFTRFTPSDGDKWEQAKRVVRATYNNLAGRLRGHLAATHFGMEQFAIALLRNVRENPIRGLLYPFIRDVLPINEKGRNTLIGGETPIVYLVMPMDLESINRLIVGTLGRQDWYQFRPRTVICEKHVYAKAANLFWEILEEFIDKFFNIHQSDISKYWYEIFKFSGDLYDNSLPYLDVPLEQSINAGDWYCFNEIPTQRSQGEKSFHRITNKSSSPGQQDLDNMKQVCVYIIYHCTFVHSWIHKYMETDLGEIRYSGLLSNGGMANEEEDSVIAPVPLAALNLNLTHVLGNMESGSLVENDDGDIPLDLIQMLIQNKEKFEEFGLPVEEFSARLNT